MNIGIHGEERSGKTTLAASLALMSWTLGKKVYANFKLYFGDRELPDGTVINTLEPFGLDPNGNEPPHLLDMGVLMARDLQSCDIFIDEAHGYFDSRSSNSIENKVMSWFSHQSGKRDIDIYYITHHSDMVDRRLRRNMKVRYFCTWMGDIKHPKSSDYIKVEMLTRNIAQVAPIRVFRLPNPMNPVPLSALFDLYDTRELVPLDPTVELDLQNIFELERGEDGELHTVRVNDKRGRPKKKEIMKSLDREKPRKKPVMDSLEV